MQICKDDNLIREFRDLQTVNRCCGNKRNDEDGRKTSRSGPQLDTYPRSPESFTLGVATMRKIRNGRYWSHGERGTMESEGGEWEGTEHKQEHKLVSVACSKLIQESV